MNNAQEKIRTKIDTLIKQGEELLKNLEKRDEEGYLTFVNGYESWYSKTLVLIKTLLPDRFDDFVSSYNNGLRAFALHLPGDVLKRSPWIDLYGLNIDDSLIVQATALFRGQLALFRTLGDINAIYNIQELLYAEMFDSELEAAKELNKKGFHRAAGAVAGVVLESHLKKVCVNHNLTLPPEKTRSINKYNDMLKQAGIIDTPTWRHIQYLADLRNKCDHDKGTEPTRDEIDDLIKGVNKIIKTVF